MVDKPSKEALARLVNLLGYTALANFKLIEPIYQDIDKLYKIQDLLEKYGIEDLAELETVLDKYYHMYNNVESRRLDSNE